MQNKALSLSSGDTLSKKCNAMLGLGIAIDVQYILLKLQQGLEIHSL